MWSDHHINKILLKLNYNINTKFIINNLLSIN